MKQYVNYHCHSEYSNVATPDVVIKNKDRVNRAKELGHTVVSGVEHGWVGNAFEVYDLAHESGLKPLLGTEAYFVKDRFEKDRTNAHLMLLAKNENGRKAINRIVSEANKSGYYSKPRVDLELVLSLPENDVWVTSACLGGIWKYEDAEELVKILHDKFKGNFFLEVQYHNTLKQKALNIRILDLSDKYDINLIAGMDSHMIYPEDAKKRDLFLESRHIVYEDEGGWFLDFPDYDTAFGRFIEQGVLNKEQVILAMDNTLLFESVEEYTSHIFDKEKIKLPSIYPNKTQEEKDEIFSDLIWNKWKEEKKKVPVQRHEEYVSHIEKELDAVLGTGMADYFLLNYEIISEAKRNGGQLTLTSRGSAPGFYLSKLLGFTTIDRVSAKVKLFPERFMSKERILETHSLPDIDFNCGVIEPFEEAQRKVLGDGKSYRMITYQKTHESSAWKMYARANNVDFDDANEVSKSLKAWRDAIKYSEYEDKEEAEYAIPVDGYIGTKYKNLYEKSKEFLGIINSLGSHPCAFLLIDEGTIEEEIGVIRTKSGEICAAVDGKTADKRLFLKNDLLKVTVVNIIYRTYERIGRAPHTVDELIDFCDGDESVWRLYKDGITLGLNQVETDATTRKVSKYAPKNISELSSFVAAIRPGFKSNYAQYSNREPFSYGIPTLDNLIQTKEFPFSYMLYQENAMAVLGYVGIPMHETYQIVKDIAKKNHDKVYAYKKKFISLMSKKLVEVEGSTKGDAKKISDMIWQIIEDSAQYSFNACVSKDTMIQKAGNTKSRFVPTIEEMFNIKNDKDYAEKTGHIHLHRKYKHSGYGNALSMYKDGRIRKNKIVDIYYSGFRDVYEVATENGSSIRCTENHKFPTPSGNVPLSKISVGDSLYVKGEYEKTKQGKNTWLSKNGVTTNHPKKGQRGFQKNPMGGSVLYKKFIQNKLSKNSPCDICGKKYSDDDRFECHHKDGDRKNNNSKNLSWLCNSCHKKEDYKIGRTKVFEKGIPTKLSKVVSINHIGKEDVYDIEMESPAHNFISENGLVTSNSHSYSVANDSLYGAWQKAHYPLEFYETLIRSYEEDSRKDKVNLAKIEAETYFGISFPSFKWGQDNTQVLMNKNANSISLSMKTIKGFGDKFAVTMNELYGEFDGETFLDLLILAEETGRLSKSKWEKMVSIDYFSEFGGGVYIKKLFDEFVSGKNRYSSKHSDNTKQKRIDGMIEFDATLDKTEAFSVIETIQNETAILGQVVTKFKQLLPTIGIVQEIDTQYSPKIWVYSLANGTKPMLKIDKKLYKKRPIEVGDIIFIESFDKKNKSVPDGEGGFTKLDEKEFWISKWHKLNNFDLSKLFGLNSVKNDTYKVLNMIGA